MELTELLPFVGEVTEHTDEVGEELPGLVEFPQQDGGQLVDVERDLVEEVDEEVRLNVGQHLPQRLSRGVAPVLGEEGILQSRIVTR